MAQLGPREAAAIRGMWKANGLVFAVAVAAAGAFGSGMFALSVAIGGLIALANFKMLERTLCRALLGQRRRAVGAVLAKYYLRFGLTALVLLVLVRQHWAEPIGLLVGLSVVVVAITVWGLVEGRKSLG